MNTKNFLELTTENQDRIHWWYKRCSEIKKLHDFYFQIWNENQNLLDANFVSQAKIDPYSKFYELYILEALLDCNLTIKQKNKNERGPDFVTEDYKVAFECIVPCIPDSYEISNSKKFVCIDPDLFKLTITSAIKVKLEQFNNWKKTNNFEGAYVICICAAKLTVGEKRNIALTKIEYSLEYSIKSSEVLCTLDDPIAQVLYGFVPKIILSQTEKDKTIYSLINYSAVKAIDLLKNGRSHSLSDVFKKEEYREISAIIFTPYDGFEMKENNLKSCFYDNLYSRINLSSWIRKKELFNLFLK